jgi:ankyrin repeat protein
LANAIARPGKELVVPQKSLPTRTLRERPDLDQLKRQAKELLDAFVAGRAEAAVEVNAHYHDARAETFALHDAQLVLGRAYGFDSWAKLKAHVDGVTMTRLADAVRAGDIPGVQAMLNVRPELAHMVMGESNEHRALHYAVLNRLPEMVRVLMEHGADARVGIYPHRVATGALTIATERGYAEIVDIIRMEERRRDAPDPRAMPALHRLFEVVNGGDHSAAIALMEADPSLIHAHAPDGWTPLHLATSILSERIVGWLLDHGAEVNAANKGGNTPLAVAASNCSPPPQDQLDRVRDMLLHRGAELTVWVAVSRGELDWIRAHRAESGRWTSDFGLLTRAVQDDRPEVLRLLLEFGLDPNERVRLRGMEEIVYSWGEPLRQCANLGKLAMAEMLLERGADPNTNVYAGSTALYGAYARRDDAMVRLLERHGAALDAGSVGNLRLTEQARQMLVDEAAGRLRQRTFYPGETLAEELLCSGASGGAPEIVRLALGRLDWSRDDPRWHRNLEATLYPDPEWDRSTYLECFRLILARCDATARGPYGVTILHDVIASRSSVGKMTPEEQVAFAATLVDAGARVDVRDDLLKSTPLGWACRWGRVELVKLLLERGADPIEADAEPWARPQAWAEKMKHDAVVALLREYGQRHS